MNQRQTLAVLFADVSGSTKLFETRGDEAARFIIGGVLAALIDIVKAHGGSVIKTIGDEVMCTFPNPLQSLLAACDMQRRLKSDPVFTCDNLGIRIGLHHGEVLLEDGDVFGDAVNIAARMTALAKRDQIVATASMVEGITRTGGLRVRSLGNVRVSGKLLPIEIVDVLWQEDISNITTVQRIVKIGDDTLPCMRMTLHYKSQIYKLDELAPPFMMGRGATNNLVIEAEWVSRYHAMIEWKRGHFVLSDRSTNGTWVKFGEEEMCIHRDEVHLRKSGVISLGRACDGNMADALFFDCEE